MKVASTFALLVSGAAAHGMISWPPPRNLHSTFVHDCEGDGADGSDMRSGTCLWFNQGCQPGCDECKMGCGVGQTAVEGPCCLGNGQMLPTLDRSMWTWTEIIDNYAILNPWRAPGYAPVNDPCGAAGGGDNRGLPGNGAYPPVGVEQGMPGSALPEREDVPKTVWKAGETAEVAFDITANHGGGYSYRLCPKSSELTEACFQATPLTYATDTHFIQFGSDWNNRTEIPAARTTEGTYPANSTWTRLPIPACTGPFGGSAGSGCGRAKRGFTPPLQEMFPPTEFKTEPGLYGFGLGSCQVDGELGEDASCTPAEYQYWKDFFAFNIIDIVNVPAGLKGEYVLSWRWDVEQTPQVWAGCSDVTIE